MGNDRKGQLGEGIKGVERHRSDLEERNVKVSRKGGNIKERW